MVKVFATKEHGFGPSIWPAIAFSNEKECHKLINNSLSDDDVVVLVCVHRNEDNEVKEEDSGRILGMATFYRDVVKTKDCVDGGEYERTKNRNNKSEFTWPYAVEMNRAWKFNNPPLASKFLETKLYINSTTQAVLLSEEDKKNIFALLDDRGEEVPVGDKVNIGKNSPAENVGNKKDTRAKGRSYGPPPTSYSVEQKRDFKGPAYVYVCRFGDSDIWKIGWAKDARKRLESLNEHVPHELLGQNWKRYLNKKYDSGKNAFDAEQAMLDLMEAEKFSMWGERVQCSEEDIKKAWEKLKQMF